MTQADNRPGRRRKREPLQVNLTMVVKTGPELEDRITILDNRNMPMVGSVFEYRDRIRRFFVGTLLRVATTSPSVLREIAPGLMALAGRGRARAKGTGRQHATRKIGK